MIMVEFYKQKLIKISSEIQDAELEKDFKRVRRLRRRKGLRSVKVSNVKLM